MIENVKDKFQVMTHQVMIAIVAVILVIVTAIAVIAANVVVAGEDRRTIL